MGVLLKGKKEKLKVKVAKYQKFKEEAMGMIEAEKPPSNITEELLKEREEGRKKDEKIKELQGEIEAIKREKIREEVSLLARQKEMMERLKEQKPKTEIDELGEQKEKIEALLRIKQKMEDVSALYEEAKRIKDKKAEAVHKESLEKLKKQALELEELRAQTKELSFLYKISSRLANILDEKELFKLSLEEAEDYFGYSLAGYIILKKKRFEGLVKTLDLSSSQKIQGLKKRMLNDWLRFNPMRKKGIKRVVELETIGEKGKGREKIISYICAPIMEKKRIIGVFSIASTKTSFSPTSGRILSILTDQLSMAVERARLFLKEEEMATRDELTGVFNFRFFRSSLDKQFEIHQKDNKPFSMIMLDFDRLKYVNDTFGHNQGNRLIKTIAHLIEKSVRKEDIVGRFGGDEFGILLPETGINVAGEIAERIRRNIAEHKMTMEEKPFSLTASLGVSFFPQANSPEGLLKMADECLYKAKQEGRNKVVVADG
ncbi:MAG: diguanylate cyclase [bacterium]